MSGSAPPSPIPATASVTEIAGMAGLGHLGRTAADHGRRYGETPSETLRRKR